MSEPLLALLNSEEQEQLMREMGPGFEAIIYDENLDLLGGNPLPNGVLSEAEEDFTDIKLSDALIPLEAARLIQPLHVTEVLSTNKYLGDFNFDISVASPLTRHGSNSNWIYSELLNKIFIIKDQLFHVDISVNGKSATPLYIRVTPQYYAPSSVNVAVIRCVQHESQDAKSGVGSPETRPHVIRSRNKDAMYIGNMEKEQRLSVIIPLGVPQQGNSAVREYFQFVCQTSCTDPGMNRRPIDLFFTLENHRGDVLGRTNFKVRVCACPKRDKEKEEADHMAPPRSRKRRMGAESTSAAANAHVEEQQQPESSDGGGGACSGDNDNVRYEIPIPVIGKRRMLDVLRYAEKLHLAAAYESRNTAEEGNFMTAVDEIRQFARQAE